MDYTRASLRKWAAAYSCNCWSYLYHVFQAGRRRCNFFWQRHPCLEHWRRFMCCRLVCLLDLALLAAVIIDSNPPFPLFSFLLSPVFYCNRERIKRTVIPIRLNRSCWPPLRPSTSVPGARRESDPHTMAQGASHGIHKFENFRPLLLEVPFCRNDRNHTEHKIWTPWSLL